MASHRKPHRRHQKKRPPLKAAPINVMVHDLGQQGDGIAKVETDNGNTDTYFIRNAMPGDELTIQPTRQHSGGTDAAILNIITPAPGRKPADCPSADHCGGCQFQFMEDGLYQRWKQDMVASALSHMGILPKEWRPTYSAGYGNRRRARLAWRKINDHVIIGFREARSHRITPPEGCLILDPEVIKAIHALKHDVLIHCDDGQKGEVDIMRCDQGWDISLRPDTPFSRQQMTEMVIAASLHPIARLAQIHASGEVDLLSEASTPTVTWSLNGGSLNGGSLNDGSLNNGTNDPAATITLALAPGSFMQADHGAEQIMQQQIAAALSEDDHIVDLFCGSGTLSLPLLTRRQPPKLIMGYDSATLALEAMQDSAKSAGHHHRVKNVYRNLFKDPLQTHELSGFSAAIIDPPRAGAAAQMPALATSDVERIMMVSCNPISFARDAKTLQDGGYHCQWVQMIDQFYRTSHVELIACFQR